MPVEKHALRAIQAAVSFLQKLSQLNDKLALEKKPQLATRIGINTGNVVVGNIGAQERMNYTVLGDPVNVSARLESACNYYGSNILIGEECLQQVSLFDLHQSDCLVCWIDYVQLAGKTQPIHIFAILPKYLDSENLVEKQILLCEMYAKAREQLMNRQIEAVMQTCDDILQFHSDEKAALQLKQRLAKNPTQLFRIAHK